MRGEAARLFELGLGGLIRQPQQLARRLAQVLVAPLEGAARRRAVEAARARGGLEGVPRRGEGEIGRDRGGGTGTGQRRGSCRGARLQKVPRRRPLAAREVRRHLLGPPQLAVRVQRLSTQTRGGAPGTEVLPLP